MKVKTFGSWSWAFGGGIPLSSISFDGTTTDLATSNYQTNTTSNVQVANDTRRVTTYPMSSHNFRAGFSFGGSVDQRAEQRDVLPLGVREREQRDPVHAGLHPARDHRRRHRGGRGLLRAGQRHRGLDRPQDARPHAGLAGLGGHRPQRRPRGLEPARVRPHVRPDRQHHLHGRQVPPGAARRRRTHVHAVVPGRVRREHRRVDPDVQPGDRRAGVEDHGVTGRHQAVRRRRVHERQRRGEHDRAGRARPGDRRPGPQHRAGWPTPRARPAPTTCAPCPSRARGSTSAATSPGSPAAPASTSPARSRSAAWPASASPTAAPTGTGSRRSRRHPWTSTPARRATASTRSAPSRC